VTVRFGLKFIKNVTLHQGSERNTGSEIKMLRRILLGAAMGIALAVPAIA